ncbi:hypothetical protein M0805_002180 [Coniferiporia weirii]|nr:hypothetical protein M0805_002180 [Coniferiporia weirii]
MSSWQTAASHSVFSVHTPSNNHQAPYQSMITPPQERNMRPCGRCSDMQKKCETSPPFSRKRCKECTKARISVCPPYKGRRGRKRRQRPVHDIPCTESVCSDKSSPAQTRDLHIVSPPQLVDVQTPSGNREHEYEVPVPVHGLGLVATSPSPMEHATHTELGFDAEGGRLDPVLAAFFDEDEYALLTLLGLGHHTTQNGF